MELLRASLVNISRSGRLSNFFWRMLSAISLQTMPLQNWEITLKHLRYVPKCCEEYAFCEVLQKTIFTFFFEGSFSSNISHTCCLAPYSWFHKTKMKLMYRPLLSNGEPAPLAWCMHFYRVFSPISWPLEDNSSWWKHLLMRVIYVGTFAIFLHHNEAEIRYLYVNFNNLDDMLTGIPTYFILIEVHIRAFTSGLYKRKFKKFLKKFYAEIFVEECERPDIYKDNLRNSYPIQCFLIFYLCTLSAFIVTGGYYLATGSRQLLYKMIPSFDVQPLYIYIPLLLSNILVGLAVAGTIVGESYSFAMFVFNLNGRYQMMRDNMNEKTQQILNTSTDGSVAVLRFSKLLVQTLKENARLNKFAHEIQEQFSFTIFVVLSFQAASLCALLFKVYTTDAISSMYYESNWEAIVEQSSDTKANTRLMKLIALAISINRKPINISGLNFFNVSLNTAVTILQGAGSYFTCLISLR
ncbi:odorant receptor 74a-like [Haematobia irritans]|uniref:odorant receptor 74a-like n=1 Tax=Haematobia irritans TaxID=7368 RepID=UPI003F504F68